jgi:hypothetical protein
LAEECSTISLRKARSLADDQVTIFQVQAIQVEQCLLRHARVLLVRCTWDELETRVQGVAFATP